MSDTVFSKTNQENLLFSVVRAGNHLFKKPQIDLQRNHPNDFLLNDFDIAQLNNLFVTIGWKANYAFKKGVNQIIDPV